ncbi:MAG TPA: response regulator transcription factor [Burkholderiaceae bacterium]|nr:response regulator transcription factor [Burkholderiaceae bacterium]
MNLSHEPPRILVVEDDPDIAALVALHLSDLPARVEQVHDGGVALRLAREGGFDAMVLDLRLPSLGGLDVCRELRAGGSPLPILMLTARNSELERVLGLELGADDYRAKPFGVLELQARVKALLRRAARGMAPAAEPEALHAGPLQVDRVQRRARLAGRELALAPREFDLLWHFLRHPGRAFTRAELLADVCGYGHDGYDHTVNSHINRLRDKLDDRSDGEARERFIHTVWGVGYRFEVAA